LDQLPSTSGGPSKPQEPGSKKLDANKRKEEQIKYGIYFDDDYDYLQHLKDSREPSNIEWDICERIYAPTVMAENTRSAEASKDVKIRLPSSVFESEFQEEVGLLNKAAPVFGPQPDLDPDIVAALDDDFDFDDPSNELEDNFMQLANGADIEELGESSNGVKSRSLLDEVNENDEYTDEENMEDDDEGEDGDSLGSLHGPQYTFADEETRSRFTNYSMSSSVVRRNKQLCLLDDRFEKMFEDYEDTEIGALDCDEIEGHMDVQSRMLLQCAEEFEEDRKKEEALNEKITSLALKEEDSSDEDFTADSEEEAKEKWDCESILSTYSTTKNRPKLIKEPTQKLRVNAKTGMPEGVLGKGLTAHNLKQFDRQCDHHEENNPRTKSVYSEISSRNKNETPEEKSRRKKLLKEIRRERRLEKKANTGAFKEEKKRQEKVRLNAKANLQGLHL
jgi:protein LTV1